MSKLEISLEYASLRLPGHCPLGVWVIPSPENIHHWSVTLFIHRGYYAGAIYRFTIEFSSNYPFDRLPPTVRFTSDCFHPLIDPNDSGRFDLSLKFPSWTPHQDFICHLLYYLKSCFKRSGLEQIIAQGDESKVPNKNAFRLYRDETQAFANLASQSAALSSSPSTLYQTPSTSGSSSSVQQLIDFSPLSDEQWNELRATIALPSSTRDCSGTPDKIK